MVALKVVFALTLLMGPVSELTLSPTRKGRAFVGPEGTSEEGRTLGDVDITDLAG